MGKTIALVGNPNSGKTTLFNHLTGSTQRVGNWPGVTVEQKAGTLLHDGKTQVIDLPGIYSLSPYTIEEIVTRDYLDAGCTGSDHQYRRCLQSGAKSLPDYPIDGIASADCRCSQYDGHRRETGRSTGRRRFVARIRIAVRNDFGTEGKRIGRVVQGHR
jgi:energy-coupling factor transporter ATP-binding protein EcfA2